ncbi:MAG: 50S ribosomal protein L29 [Candidatus Liberibacter ctenarytainae]|uniref:Large ribosomal subunit protein uL29 n=1 Tax=Candidatus Liberibacter ctenarytainae TaxID=2020335 RepID=A0A937AL28_9HYPH|nr:50S ribosomal protein L29 [Candidatus Liberibacter ctenarytainae]
MLKVADLLVMSIEQLKEQLVQLKKEQFNLRFQKASGQLEDPLRIRGISRDIARVKTVMNSKNDKKKS